MKLAALKIVKLLTRLKRHQKITPSTSAVKINVGSDFTVADGWINIDSSIYALISGFPDAIKRLVYQSSDAHLRLEETVYLDILKNHTFVFHNVEYGLPFPDNSVHYVYSSHFLEHLYKDDAKRLLRDAYRVLTPGGKIRLCVPDLEYVLSLFRKGDSERALTFFFDDKKGYFYTHKYMYNFELLRALLNEVGFDHVIRCSYKTGEVPDIEKLDNKPDETLYVEATKTNNV
jgi:predicted SAM-dependent methyltransferase